MSQELGVLIRKELSGDSKARVCCELAESIGMLFPRNRCDPYDRRSMAVPGKFVCDGNKFYPNARHGHDGWVLCVSNDAPAEATSDAPTLVVEVVIRRDFFEEHVEGGSQGAIHKIAKGVSELLKNPSERCTTMQYLFENKLAIVKFKGIKVLI